MVLPLSTPLLPWFLCPEILSCSPNHLLLTTYPNLNSPLRSSSVLPWKNFQAFLPTWVHVSFSLLVSPSVPMDVCSTDLWGTCKIKTIFIIILDVICLSNCITICNDGAKVIVGKTASTLAQSHIGTRLDYQAFFTTTCSQWKKQVVTSLKNVLDGAVISTNFTKSWALSTHLFNILWGEMEVPIQHFRCTQKYDDCLKGKGLQDFWVVH